MTDSYPKMTDAVNHFIQTSEDLSRKLSGPPEDFLGLRTSAIRTPSRISISEDTEVRLEQIRQEFAAAFPEIQSFDAGPERRNGLKFAISQEEMDAFTGIVESADPNANVPGDLSDTLRTLNGRLTDINKRLGNVAREANDDFQKLSKTASSDFKIAIEKVMPLAVLIRGDWKYSAGETDKAKTLSTAICQALKTASKSAQATVSKMQFYEDVFAQIRDADLLGIESGLQNEAKRFKSYNDFWITRTNQELEALKQNLEENRGIMLKRQEDLNEATKRYVKAVADPEDTSLGVAMGEAIDRWPWPVGLALHKTGQNFIDNVSNAQKTVDEAKTQDAKMQGDICKIEARAGGLQKVRGRFEESKVNSTVVQSGVTQAAAAAEIYQKVSKMIEDQTIDTWSSVEAAENFASAADWAITKEHYANVIFETLDKARFEKGIRATAIDILNELRDHDDLQKSVAGISAPLLTKQSFLQSLLEMYGQM